MTGVQTCALPIFGWLRDGTLTAGLFAGVLFGIEFVLIFRGLLLTSASRAVVFLYTAPFFVALGSYQFLGERLSALIWEGPPDRLTLTENAQPALMAVSIAVARVLKREAGLDLAREAAFVAGHSLGEYAALAAAGALAVPDTARLLRIRGLAMQKAVPVGSGAMAALFGLERDAVEAVAAEAAQGQVCEEIGRAHV